MNDISTLLYLLFKAFLFLPCLVILLDVARLATFLFYNKHDQKLPKNSMVATIGGQRYFSLKNLFAGAILIPSAYLLYYLAFNFRHLNINFIIAYYGLALLIFVLLGCTAYLGKKLQLEIHSRAFAWRMFIIEIILLLAIVSLAIALPAG